METPSIPGKLGFFLQLGTPLLPSQNLFAIWIVLSISERHRDGQISRGNDKKIKMSYASGFSLTFLKDRGFAHGSDSQLVLGQCQC